MNNNTTSQSNSTKQPESLVSSELLAFREEFQQRGQQAKDDTTSMRRLCPACFEKLITLQLSQCPPTVYVYCQFCLNPITRKGVHAENFDAAVQLLNKNYEQSITTPS